MKKFFIAALSLVSSISAVEANWSEESKKTYSKLMFNTAMEYQRYSSILSVPQTIDMINCIGSFYEVNYTYNEWERMFYEGTDEEVQEFSFIEEVCIGMVKMSSEEKPQSINI